MFDCMLRVAPGARSVVLPCLRISLWGEGLAGEERSLCCAATCCWVQSGGWFPERWVLLVYFQEPFSPCVFIRVLTLGAKMLWLNDNLGRNVWYQEGSESSSKPGCYRRQNTTYCCSPFAPDHPRWLQILCEVLRETFLRSGVHVEHTVSWGWNLLSH